MDRSDRVQTLSKAKLAKHLPDGRLCVPLDENHVGLHVHQRILLNQVGKELDSSFVGCDLGLEVSDVVFQVSCTRDQGIHILWLIVQNISQLNFVEHSVLNNLKAKELGTFLLDVLRKGRH